MWVIYNECDLFSYGNTGHSILALYKSLDSFSLNIFITEYFFLFILFCLYIVDIFII